MIVLIDCYSGPAYLGSLQVDWPAVPRVGDLVNVISFEGFFPVPGGRPLPVTQVMWSSLNGAPVASVRCAVPRTTTRRVRV